MTDFAPCGEPATHAVQLHDGHGFYFACESCIDKARESHPDTVNVRPIRAAEVGQRCVVPGVNC